MDFKVLTWLFAAAVTLHNLEEAIWLPNWSASAGRWHHPVRADVFRFAVLALTLLAYVASVLASLGDKQGAGAYLVAGYALAMLLNVVFPHLLATVALRRYAPGMMTALILNLPVTVGLLRQAAVEGYIDLDKFVFIGPLVVVGIGASIPVLFTAGKRILGSLVKS